MDSSPDLSLKLRRGSNDSRDSYYMDFAQGIDSDIEEVATIAAAPGSIDSATMSPVIDLDSDEIDDPELVAIHSESIPLQISIPLPIIEQPEPESEPEIDMVEVEEPEPESQPDPIVVETIIPPLPLPLAASIITHSSENNNSTTDDDEDNSRMTPLPMPILPPIPIQMLPPKIPLVQDDEGALMEIQPPPIKMPSSPTLSNAMVSPETLSHHSSPAKTSRICYQPHHNIQHQTIDGSVPSSKVPLSISSHHQLAAATMGTPIEYPHSSISGLSGIHSDFGPSHQQICQSSVTTQTSPTSGPRHLALLYHSSSHHHHHHVHPQLPAMRRPSRLPPAIYTRQTEIKPYQMFATTLSALYGKLLVVMGIAFPMAEVISTYIPPSFYEVFYLYLYIGSMLFLFFMYATILWGKPKAIKVQKRQRCDAENSSELNSSDESDTESGLARGMKPKQSVIVSPLRRPSVLAAIGGHHYGSFYLRMGAVAFGIGSMIYSGLEFGQYFELERDTKCHNVMLALTPATRMAFIFIQMYFIFLNNEQMKVYRHKIIARFGLMHMIGTNLSVWLNVLIQETKHEILTFYDPENRTLRISHRLSNKAVHHAVHDTALAHARVPRGLKGPHHIFECRRSNIIGTLVQDASPFLFPCTIEYSLICAAILYVMWRGICRPQQETPVRINESLSPCKRSPHHYSVDCARAHKGLFTGILILVLTIISLILFFVLISRPEFVTLAVNEVTICELTLYGTATLATIIGMFQVRHLQYDSLRRFQLDDILLVGAQTGLFLYSIFTVIGGHFTMRNDTILVLITALASIVQTACQTMFILDASRRNAATAEHMRKKPGREIVTFLLVANLAMWAISTLEKSRAESHPIQLNFYGLWAWTIITHVSMPLAIFYRFHSTVCLCEIWKRAYKLKPTYM